MKARDFPKHCECPCGCLALPTEPISSLKGAFVIIGGKHVVCPMCAEDFHRSAWL